MKLVSSKQDETDNLYALIRELRVDLVRLNNQLMYLANELGYHFNEHRPHKNEKAK